MSSTKLLLFDLDDTLIHFDDYWKPSLMETFLTHESSKDLEAHPLFDCLWNHNERYEAMYHQKEITIEQFRNGRLIDALADVGRSIDERTAEDFNNLHKKISKSYMKADQAVIALLADLKSSYSLGIVTNGTSSWQHDKIDAMGIRPFFHPQSIIISEDVGFEKPDPEIFHKALSVFQVLAKETVFIGDSWMNDVEGSGSVGMQSIWFNKKNEEVRQYARLKGAITKIEELKHFL